jgi:signal transduction histidine kinase
MSLRNRLLLSHALAIACALTVALVALLVLLREIPERQRQEQLINRALDLSNFGRLLPAAETTPQRLRDRLARFAAARGARALIADERGLVIADSAVLGTASLNGNSLAFANLTQTDGADPIRTSRGAFVDGVGRRYIYGAVETGQTGAPWLVLATQANERRVTLGALDELTAPLLQAFLVALALSAIVAVLIARSVARPVQRITHAARLIAAGDMAQRVPVDGPAEIQQLATDFNHMTREVHNARETERALIANVSHELRTPLTTIGGFAQAIRDGDVRDDADVKRAAGIIADDAARLQRLTGDLLDSARMASGAVEMAFAAVDMNPLVDAAMARVESRAQSQSVSISTALTAGLPQVQGDRDRLLQVLTNLLDNALKHTRPGDRVVIGTRVDAQQLVMEVADTGRGIPPDDLPHVFDRLYQADRSRSSGGAGLGLAICRQIVEAHAGHISAESVLDIGTRITIRLPLKRG